YASEEVFALERERLFAREWYYACREEHVEEPGAFVSADVVGESILVLRGRDGELRAFYNVCRHRGSRLCDEERGSVKGAIKCPYPAWAYGQDGRRVGTPNVRPDEIARDSMGLWRASVAVWEGFVFVSLAPDPEPLMDWLAGQPDQPLALARFK